jgi:hypothetical protein
MENTQFSFLNSLLGGKLSGDALPNGKQLFAQDSDSPDGNGFFTFLEGLLKTDPKGDEELVNIFAGQAPPTFNAETLRETLEGKTAGPLSIKLGSLPTTDPLQPAILELQLESLPLDPVAKPEAIDIAGKAALAAPPQGLQAAITAPVQTAITKSAINVQPGADGSDPALSEIEVPAGLREIEGESRFEPLVRNAHQKQPVFGPHLNPTGALAIAEHAAADAAQLSSAQSIDDVPAGIEFDRLSSHRVDLTANVTDRNIHLNQVRDQIVAAVSTRHGEGKLEIRLDPPELGKVLIGFERDGGDLVRAVISADSPETLDLMRRHADVFQRALEAQGFENLDLHFADKGPGENADPQSDDTARSFSLAEEENLAELVAGAPQTANGRLDRRL